MEKIIRGKQEVIKTSWGLIIRDHNSLLLNIEGVGQLEIFGWLTVEKLDDATIRISGSEYERPVKVAEGKLKA
jgi:hypothetical protein